MFYQFIVFAMLLFLFVATAFSKAQAEPHPTLPSSSLAITNGLSTDLDVMAR